MGDGSAISFSSSGSGFIGLWANAVATFEGFYSSGSRPARNHNPGDLKYAGQPGALGQDAQGFAVFPDDGTGWTALDNQLLKYVSDFPGYSLYQIMEHYLGQNVTASGGQVTSQGDSTTYANYVASALGVDPSTTLQTLAAGAVSAVSSALPMLMPAPANDSLDGSVPGQNGMLLLLAGGVLIFWLISSAMGWD